MKEFIKVACFAILLALAFTNSVSAQSHSNTIQNQFELLEEDSNNQEIEELNIHGDCRYPNNDVRACAYRCGARRSCMRCCQHFEGSEYRGCRDRCKIRYPQGLQDLPADY